jgi:hypothetical protein
VPGVYRRQVSDGAGLATGKIRLAAGVRRLFAAYQFSCAVVRDDVERSCEKPLDSQNEYQEVPVKARSTGWLG